MPERRPSGIFLGDVRTHLVTSLKLADLLPSFDTYRVPPVNIRELIPSRSEAPMAIHGGAPALPSGSRRSRRPTQEMAPELLERLERLEREKVELQGQWMVNEKRPTETVGGKFEKPCMPLTPRGGGPPHRPGPGVQRGAETAWTESHGIRVHDRSVAYEMGEKKTEMRHPACLRTG